MAKNRQKQKDVTQQSKPTPGSSGSGLSKIGKKVILSGIGVLVIGFFLLTKTDPKGQNWASILSPFLIIGAYITIGIGIILPDKDKQASQ